MNTIGRGNEGWFVGISVVLMVGVGILLCGGVAEFMSAVDGTVMDAVRTAGAWMRSLT
jgi:hypothetical protein